MQHILLHIQQLFSIFSLAICAAVPASFASPQPAASRPGLARASALCLFSGLYAATAGGGQQQVSVEENPELASIRQGLGAFKQLLLLLGKVEAAWKGRRGTSRTPPWSARGASRGRGHHHPLPHQEGLPSQRRIRASKRQHLSSRARELNGTIRHSSFWCDDLFAAPPDLPP